MLLELYILFEVVAILSFIVGYFNQNIWFSAIGTVLFGLLIFASTNIEQNVAVVTNSTISAGYITYSNEVVTKVNRDMALFYINMGAFLLCLVFFLNDLFDTWKQNKLAERK